MAFDYDSPDVSAERIAAVVAEISGGGLKPLSDEEREQRQIDHERFVAECRERDRQQRLEYEQKRLAAAEAQRVQARHNADVARAEERKRLDAELQERLNRRTHDRRLADIHAASARQEAFRHHAVRAATFANQRQRLKSLLYPPEPPPLPEPEIAADDPPVGSFFGEPGFSVELWSKRRRSWW